MYASMFKFLRKLFMMEETTKLSEEEQKKQAEEQEKIVAEANKKIEAARNGEIQKKAPKLKSQASTDPTGHWTKVQKPRFEIELYEEDTYEETGEFKGWKKVPSDKPIIIEAASKADLDEHAQRFALCHQKMKIVRKLDDGVAPQRAPQQNSQQSFQQMTIQQQIQEAPKSKPKFYKIGDIEIKNDNGKIYQKQWMKLSETEATNFRIVNDKTNALVNLNGKHLEMKKWVLVENSDDETSSLEENLND